MCGGAGQYQSVRVCVRVCAQLCGRASCGRLQEGTASLCPPTWAPTELASETFLGLTATKQKLPAGSVVSLATPKQVGEGMVGTREKGVIWLQHQLQPPSFPLKIARDKMLSRSQHSPGKGEGTWAATKEQLRGAARVGEPGPGSRTCFLGELAPPASPSLPGDLPHPLPSTTHFPHFLVLEASRSPRLPNEAKGVQSPRLPGSVPRGEAWGRRGVAVPPAPTP